ncbi:MAG: hypothetical protein IFK93_15985 [Acidobacteria bacterium]|nr:hypothetical protein [Candidatus Sulfomarinibacter kjeldsenii]
MARRPINLIRLHFFLLLALMVSGVAEASSGRTAVLSDLRIDERVAGDVVVFGADLELGPGARVEGDAVAIGGDIRVAEGAVVTRHVVAVLGGADVPVSADIGGRVLCFSSPATLLSTSTTRGSSLRTDFSMHLLAAGGWLLVTTGLAFLFPARMRFGAWAVPSLGIKIPALGMMAGLTVFASLIAALGLGPALGVPLVGGFMVIFFVARAVGLTVLGCWIGTMVLKRWVHHPLPISLEVFVGVLVLLAVRFLPLIGETLWTLISLIALGASIAALGISTDLMRAEPSNANQ